MSFWNEIISFTTTPTAAYVLLLVGIYGIAFECMNPGLVFPGFIGVLSLVVSIHALSVIGVSWVGMTLFILGVICMALSLFFKRFGPLALLGIAGLFVGAYFLFDSNGIKVDLGVIIFFTILTAVFFFVVMKLAVRSQNKPVITGGQNLIGRMAEVSAVTEDSVTVKLLGEAWTAKSSADLAVGDQVKVTGRDGLILYVEKGE